MTRKNTYWAEDKPVQVSAKLEASANVETSGSGYITAIHGGGTVIGTVDVYSETAEGGDVIARLPSTANGVTSAITFPADARPRFTNGFSVDIDGGTDPDVVVYYWRES